MSRNEWSWFDERHEAPKQRSARQDQSKDHKNGSVTADAFEDDAADRWSNQLDDSIDEKRNSVGGGEFLLAQHVRHDDRRDTHINSRSQTEHSAIKRYHHIVRCEWQDRQGHSG